MSDDFAMFIAALESPIGQRSYLGKIASQRIMRDRTAQLLTPRFSPAVHLIHPPTACCASDYPEARLPSVSRL